MLRFVTACRRAPLGGFQHLRPAFCIHQVTLELLLLSIALSGLAAHWCFDQLVISIMSVELDIGSLQTAFNYDCEISKYAKARNKKRDKELHKLLT